MLIIVKFRHEHYVKFFHIKVFQHIWYFIFDVHSLANKILELVIFLG